MEGPGGGSSCSFPSSGSSEAQAGNGLAQLCRVSHTVDTLEAGVYTRLRMPLPEDRDYGYWVSCGQVVVMWGLWTPTQPQVQSPHPHSAVPC